MAAEHTAHEALPKDVCFEWTDLTYQQILIDNSAVWTFLICVLLVFLVLAVQYGSSTLPLVVILIVSMSLFAVMLGMWVSHGDSSIFTRIGLVVLMGLACKDVILVVKFVRELELQGRTIIRAAIKARRLCPCPVLMTSITFIMGVVPLVVSAGAGAEIRHAAGVTVFAGMLGTASFGLFPVPAFYVLLRTLAARHGQRSEDAPDYDLGLDGTLPVPSTQH